MENTKLRPPLSQIIIYAIGQFGWSLASFGAGNLMPYFFMRAENDSDVVFPTFFYQGSILGVLTVLGIILASGRLLDAFTDPWIAKISDNSPIKGVGKRKRLMALSAFPFALSAFLMFYPIMGIGNNWNILWLIVISIIYFISFTMYLIPYNALIAELGHHPDDRMKISTIISVTWILGFATGFILSYGLIGGMVEGGQEPVIAFQTIMAGFSIVAFICMLVPVFFLKEHKYALQSENSISESSGLSKFAKLIKTDKNLKYFVISDMVYWLSATFITMGISFYVITLMGKDEAASADFLKQALIVSLLLYVPINMAVKKFGKKLPTLIAFAVYIIIFGITGFIDYFPISIDILFIVTSILAAYPMAVFGIIPNAILADLTHAHEAKTGVNEAGAYFAVRTFMMKIGITLANLIFPSLLLLGKSVDNPMGVRATAVAAMIFCTIGMFIFNQYKSPETT